MQAPFFNFGLDSARADRGHTLRMCKNPPVRADGILTQWVNFRSARTSRSIHTRCQHETGLQPILFLERELKHADIAGVSVPIFGVAKSIADAFRHRRSVGMNVATRALQESLRQRKVSPSEIAAYAIRGGVWSLLHPYLEAFTVGGYPGQFSAEINNHGH